MIREAYKIVEIDNGKIKTLFHGISGTRTMQEGVWIEADIKQGRDGSGDRWYTTGFHTLPTLEEAQEYMTRFKARKELLKIVKVDIKGVWKKEHSPHNVLLSKYIKFKEVM